MAKWKDTLGLSKTVHNPTVIANHQHDDKSKSQRNLSGTPATYETIIASSTTLTVVPDFCVLRVCNTAATVAFIYVGRAADAPGGAPTIANGLAIPPNTTECLFVGKLDDDRDSVFIKTSATTLQVVVCEQ